MESIDTERENNKNCKRLRDRRRRGDVLLRNRNVIRIGASPIIGT